MTEKSQDESTETLPASEPPASSAPGAEPETPAASAQGLPRDDFSSEETLSEETLSEELSSDEHAGESESAGDGETAGSGAPEQEETELPGTESSGQTSATPAGASAVRHSQPTPPRPNPTETGSEESGLSDFFDNLDEKFMDATRRLASAFRRPEPATQAPEQAQAQDHPDSPAESEHPSVQEETPGTSTPAPSPGDPDDAARPATAAEEPDPEPASGSGDPVNAPEATSDPNAGGSTPAEGPLTEAQEEPAAVTLPKPRRALDERRQRDVILEKAAAIEAATARNYRPTGREFVEFADDEEDLFTYIPPYNLPSRDPDPAPVRTDLYRQVFVSLGALAALVSLIWMFGAFTAAPAILGGNGLDQLVEGWYSGDLALLSPDANFYWLWPFIVIGLIAHAVYQWTTTQTATPRQRLSGWQVGSASLLMLVWTAAVHHGMLTIAVLASLAVALALIDAIRQFTFRTARSSLERRLADTTTGLFAGWALVAGMSSLSIWLTAMGWRVPGFPAVIWALIGLSVCIWAASYYAMTERGRITLALGMGWGMFWLIFPRILSEVTSVWVALCAAMGAFVVILATESRRHKINHAERRAAMGRPLEDII
ncbi:hypothetical protein [Nesterenkonia lutea]|uniref:Uncharacterized protein n=1 Tax=Nesterenkonia lutea TaxID=272919 RepID=A0ABR9JB73_9MICC|nr:hypothetical protein [Nesterenkonia lutea]MBE1523177.1 hypothetical protein [Nesterenkonia lutea]